MSEGRVDVIGTSGFTTRGYLECGGEGSMMLLVGAIVGLIVSGVILSVGLAWGDRGVVVAAAVAVVAFFVAVVLVGASL